MKTSFDFVKKCLSVNSFKTLFAFGIFAPLCVLSAMLCACGKGGVELYEYPIQISPSKNFSATVDGKNCFVFAGTTGDAAAFDAPEGAEIDIKIKSAREIKSLVIRPLSKNISPKFTSKEISFKMKCPAQLSVEINGDLDRPLYVFASPLQKNVPDKNAENVIFFERGKIHNIGHSYPIKKNGTVVYIEGGAIVRGGFLVGDRKIGKPVSDIKFCGRGIVDGSDMPLVAPFRNNPEKLETLPSSRLFDCHRVKRLEIEGVMSQESPTWTLALFECDGVRIDGYKSLGGSNRRKSDDAIDIIASKNVVVQNSFIRAKDDCIVLKSAKLSRIRKVGYMRADAPNIVENIAVRNCVIWNHIHGNAIEIGYETMGDEIKNAVFENIDIIHSLNNPNWLNPVETTFSIHNSGRAHIHDILYKNIRVEDPQVALVYFSILNSVYTKENATGKISNIVFENIDAVSKTPLVSVFKGLNKSADIKNVTFKNVKINGKLITSLKDLNAQTEFAEGFIFKK